MKKMILTTYENQTSVKKDVYFLSVFYRPGEGVRALVINDNNQVQEVNPYALSLSITEYNKIFTE